LKNVEKDIKKSHRLAPPQRSRRGGGGFLPYLDTICNNSKIEIAFCGYISAIIKKPFTICSYLEYQHGLLFIF